MLLFARVFGLHASRGLLAFFRLFAGPFAMDSISSSGDALAIMSLLMLGGLARQLGDESEGPHWTEYFLCVLIGLRAQLTSFILSQCHVVAGAHGKSFPCLLAQDSSLSLFA